MAARDTVTQFTAQEERFVTSPHVNAPEPARRFLAAVAPRGDEIALDVACGPGLLAPSHTSAWPLAELVQLLGLVGLQVDKIETIDYDRDVEDWIARAEQSADDAQRARQLIAAAIGTRKFGGKRVWRDEDGKLWFSVRCAILAATKPS